MFVCVQAPLGMCEYVHRLCLCVCVRVCSLQMAHIPVALERLKFPLPGNEARLSPGDCSVTAKRLT